MSFPLILKKLKAQDPSRTVQGGNREPTPGRYGLPYTLVTDPRLTIDEWKQPKLSLPAPELSGSRSPSTSPAMDYSVTVLERGRAMAESSWAAAGMLAANDPGTSSQNSRTFARLSLALYPDYLAQIEQLSGMKVPLLNQSHNPAHLRPTTLPTASNELPQQLAFSPQPKSGPSNPDCKSTRKTILLLDESSLDPRDLCAALPAAAIAAGVKLIEDSPVISIDAETTRVVVQTAATAFTAAHFVNCAGAWAESPAFGRLPPSHPRISPAKGQMTTVRLRGRETLTHVLRTPEIYLVPRGEGSDGRIAIGATVEHAGFDKTVEPHAIAGLLKAAAELFPPIAEAEILESWAGLRPASSDDLPLIGASPQSAIQPNTPPNTWVATGHFRNGILLAPATARALSQLIRGETPSIDLAPFAPGRYPPAIARPLDRLVPPASDNRSTAAL